jgi:hypothetical protein
MKKLVSTTLLITMFAIMTFSQKNEQDSTYRKFYVGSSAFIFMNLNTNDPNAPDFAQLNFGYRITPKDVISLEAKTFFVLELLLNGLAPFLFITYCYLSFLGQ